MGRGEPQQAREGRGRLGQIRVAGAGKGGRGKQGQGRVGRSSQERARGAGAGRGGHSHCQHDSLWPESLPSTCQIPKEAM